MDREEEAIARIIARHIDPADTAGEGWRKYASLAGEIIKSQDRAKAAAPHFVGIAPLTYPDHSLI